VERLPQNGAGDAGVATYHDTPDRRLARAGIRIRRRMEKGNGIWEALLGEVVLTARGGPVSPPEELRRQLGAVLRGDDVGEVIRLRTAPNGVDALEARRVVDRFADLDDALPPPSPEATPRKSEPTLEHVRASLRRQLRAIERHDAPVRLGGDAEDLHQMRVAVRRARAVLRAARPMLEPQWTETLRAELRWLGQELGPVRDLDVLLEHLRAEALALGGPEAAGAAAVVRALELQRDAARESLLEALESPRYFALLDALEDAARAPRTRSANVSLEAIAAREFSKLRRAMRALPKEPADADIHRARIRAKRARYAAELVRGKRAARFVKAAKRFQDVTGTSQDTVVAEERIRTALRGERGKGAALAAGRLIERERARRGDARAAVPKAWRKLERRGRKAWA
jgi:CHAD domain-containing protein